MLPSSSVSHFTLFIFATALFVIKICHVDTANDLKGADDDDHGSWSLPDERPIIESNEAECTVERVLAKELTQKRFLNEFAFKRPVVIVGFDDNRTFQELCRKPRLLADWGNASVVLSSANTYSYTKVPSTLLRYVESMRPQTPEMLGNKTLYLFGDIDQELWKPLLSEYRVPPWTLPDYSPALSFGIAPVGTGVPFHFHGPGFAEVIHGSKLWFLQEFDRRPEFDPDESTLSWFLMNKSHGLFGENRKTLQCLLKPGELIFFPDKWWHATLNTRTSVFMSTFLSRDVTSGAGKPLLDEL